MDETSGAESALIGAVDRLTVHRVAGWAWDPARPEASVLVEVLDGEEQIAVVLADLPRPDLAGLGTGFHAYGFAVDLGSALVPKDLHRMRVRRLSDQRDLLNSPQLLVRGAGDWDGILNDLVPRALRGSGEATDGLAPLDAHLARLAAQLDQAFTLRQEMVRAG